MSTRHAFFAAVVFAALASLAPFASVAAADDAQILAGHSASVFALALSRDDHVLASASADNTVKLWDVSSGGLLTTLSKEFTVVSAVSLSSNGVNVAVGIREGQILVWDTTPGEDPIVLSGHRGVVRCLAYSANDAWLASGGSDRTIRLWNGKSREFKLILEGHARGVFSLAFSPDEKTLASGSSDETVKIWNIGHGADETPFALRARAKRGTIVSLAYSPDGRELALATPEVVEVWDAVQNQRRAELPAPEKGGQWWSVRYTAQGRLIAIGCGARYARALRVNAKKGVSTGTHEPHDDEIRLWAVQARREVRRLVGHRDSVRAVALTNDATVLASGSRDHSVRLWDLTGSSKRHRAPSVRQVSGSNSVAPDAPFLPGPMGSGGPALPGSDSEAARQEALQALQHLTESPNLFPASGMVPARPLADDVDASGDDASDSNVQLPIGWADLIELLPNKGPFAPSDGGAPFGQSKKFGGTRATPPAGTPPAAGSSHAAPSGSDELRASPISGPVNDSAGWGRREAYERASRVTASSGPSPIQDFHFDGHGVSGGGGHDGGGGGSHGGHDGGGDKKK
jgi:WD40 repeat protein